MLRIVRKSDKKNQWIPANIYKTSFYNIIEKSGTYVAIYNSASGAIAIGENFPFEVECLPECEIKALVENGFLVNSETEEFEQYFSTLEFKQKSIVDFFTIILTTACNAHCFYCYEKEYSVKNICEKFHIKIVDYLEKKIISLDKFVLDWYGGEPLLCVNEIDKIIADLKKRVDFSNKKWISTLTTNATLFSKELIEHAKEYWNLKLVHITIDGVEEEHNIRKNITDAKESAFFKTCTAIQGLLDMEISVNLRIHMDNENKNSFPQILQSIKKFLMYKNFYLFPTFLFPPEYSMPETYITDCQKEQLFYDVFEAIDRSEYHLRLPEIFPKPKKQNCFATKNNTVVISPDGSLHACVQEFSGSSSNEKFADYSQYCIECRSCRYFPICLGGCIHNRSLKGTVRTPCVRNRFVIHPLLKILLEREQKIGEVI